MNSLLRDPSRKGPIDPALREIGAQVAGGVHTHLTETNSGKIGLVEAK
jgi:hypothetical protein